MTNSPKKALKEPLEGLEEIDVTEIAEDEEAIRAEFEDRVQEYAPCLMIRIDEYPGALRGQCT